MKEETEKLDLETMRRVASVVTGIQYSLTQQTKKENTMGRGRKKEEEERKRREKERRERKRKKEKGKKEKESKKKGERTISPLFFPYD